uniref:Uncharacterized protein n=1 Tax=Solanum tuberosum TaxID=4113 RepID=M1A304_SOLTU
MSVNSTLFLLFSDEFTGRRAGKKTTGSWGPHSFISIILLVENSSVEDFRNQKRGCMPSYHIFIPSAISNKL